MAADPADNASKDALLLGCSDGLYEVAGDTAKPVHAPGDTTFRAAFLLKSKVDPARVWIGLFDGLASFRRIDGRWVDEGRVPGVTEQIRSGVEDADGSLWLGTQSAGAIGIRFATPPRAGVPRPEARITRYGVADGLQSSGQVIVQSLRGRVYFVNGTRRSEGVRVRPDAAEVRPDVRIRRGGSRQRVVQ